MMAIVVTLLLLLLKALMPWLHKRKKKNPKKKENEFFVIFFKQTLNEYHFKFWIRENEQKKLFSNNANSNFLSIEKKKNKPNYIKLILKG